MNAATGGAERADHDEGQDLLATQFRHQAGKVSRQAAVFFAGTVFTVFAGYFFKIYVARVLGAEQLGVYTLGMRIVGILSLFAGLGLPVAAARFVSAWSRDQPDKVVGFWWRSLLLTVSSGVGFGLVLFLTRGPIARTLFNEPDLANVLPLFAVLLPVSVVAGLAAGYLRGHQQVAKRAIIGNFIQVPTKILLTISFLSLGMAVAGYVTAEIASVLVALLLMLRIAARLTKRTTGRPGRPEYRQPLGKDVRIFAASIVGMSFLGFLASQADQLLVGVFLEAEHVGIYGVVAVTGAFVPTILTSLNSIFGPIIADLHTQGETAVLGRLFQTSTKWCLGLTWPLAVTLIAFASSMMRIFGPEFVQGSSALAIVTAAQLVNVGAGSSGTLLVMSGNQRLEIFISAMAGLLTLSLDVIMIPRWGITGAAAAFAAGLTLSNALRVLMVGRHMRLVPYRRTSLLLAFPMLASALVTLAVRSVSDSQDWAYWLGPLTALPLAYAGFLVPALAFALDSDDRLIGRAALQRLASILGKRSGGANR